MCVLQDLLKQMAEQKVKPNLLTFNAVLKALRRCGALGKSQAFPVISEMKALNIGPMSDTRLFMLYRNEVVYAYLFWCVIDSFSSDFRPQSGLLQSRAQHIL